MACAVGSVSALWATNRFHWADPIERPYRWNALAAFALAAIMLWLRLEPRAPREGIGAMGEGVGHDQSEISCVRACGFGVGAIGWRPDRGKAAAIRPSSMRRRRSTRQRSSVQRLHPESGARAAAGRLAMRRARAALSGWPRPLPIIRGRPGSRCIQCLATASANDACRARRAYSPTCCRDCRRRSAPPRTPIRARGR